MRVQALLKDAAKALEAAGVPDAQVDAALLLGHLLGWSRLQVLARGGEDLPEDLLPPYQALLARRLQREPLQYLLGEAGFMDLRLLTRPDVLIPRSDTEALAEQSLLRLRPQGRALDLCTGTGALAIWLKKSRPGAEVCGSDISPLALALAEENALLNGVAVDWRLGDLFQPFFGERFHLICCNPPYIPSADLDSLQAEVRFEPRLALDGGADGLNFYRRILQEAPRYLHPGGSLLLEAGDGQMEALKALVRLDFDLDAVYIDGGGLPRVLAARKKG